MTFQGDPYRSLGVEPGASLNEIKSAYRRLVKQYHPDRAGERALPRFLAIQAAYERLVDGEGRLRPMGSGPRPGRGAAPRPSESWRADPNRPRASRDAWRARRSTGSSPASGGGAGSKAGGGAAPGSKAGGGAGPGSGYSWAKPGQGPRRERTHREHRRGPRKATPGSTTYDEAAELPLDPEWDGGAWYGPSSGTYWTINPREYADPRKHGPEYLARARRAARGQGAAAGSPDAPFDDPSADAEWRWEAEAGPAGPSATGAGGEWGTRGWQYDDVTDPGPPDPRMRARAERATGPTGTTRPSTTAADVAFPDLEEIARRFAPLHLLALARRPDLRWRFVIALTAWPPIGYSLAALLTEVTGCAALSPSCPEPVSMLALLLQPIVFTGLFLVPPAAVVAAFAGIVALAVALPVSAVLAVGSLPDARVGAPVLGVAVAVAYLVAFLWGAREVWRAPARPPEGPPKTNGTGSGRGAP